MRSMASSYALMVSSNSELNYLLSLDTGDTMGSTEKVVNTAEKLGFVLPTQYENKLDKNQTHFYYIIQKNL